MAEYPKEDLVCVMRPRTMKTGEIYYVGGDAKNRRGYKLWPSKKEDGAYNLMTNEMPEREQRQDQRGGQERRAEQGRMDVQQRGAGSRDDDSNPFD